MCFCRVWCCRASTTHCAPPAAIAASAHPRAHRCWLVCTLAWPLTCVLPARSKGSRRRRPTVRMIQTAHEMHVYISTLLVGNGGIGVRRGARGRRPRDLRRALGAATCGLSSVRDGGPERRSQPNHVTAGASLCMVRTTMAMTILAGYCTLVCGHCRMLRVFCALSPYIRIQLCVTPHPGG